MHAWTRASAAAAAAIIALSITATPAQAEPPTPTMHDFLTTWVTDVGNYWATVPGVTPAVQYYWPMPGESVTSGCGNVPSNNDSAYYCPETDILVISQDLAIRIWNGQYEIDPGHVGQAAGDFGLTYVIAHEYAHNVQHELGILSRGLPIVNTELHADCWAGVWARAKADAGQLEPGDMDEVLHTVARVGSDNYSDPQFHGTAAQRVTAWAYGFDNVAPINCDNVLNQKY